VCQNIEWSQEALRLSSAFFFLAAKCRGRSPSDRWREANGPERREEHRIRAVAVVHPASVWQPVRAAG
jgi:hypothetical protein